MAYKVFISHSTADMELVYQLKYWLEANGIEAHVGLLAQHHDAPLLEGARSAIEHSDCVLAVLTVDGSRSEAVNQEIRHAATSNRLIVPIVEVGVQPRGFLADHDYVLFDRLRPEDAINAAVRYVYAQKLGKESQEKAKGTVLFALGLLALATVGSSREHEDVH